MNIQLGLYGLAAFIRVDFLFFWEERHLISHCLNNLLINSIATGYHFSPDTHLHVLVLQGQEGNKVVNEVPVNEAAVPQSTWRSWGEKKIIKKIIGRSFSKLEPA